MAFITTPKNGATFNKKSGVVVNGGGPRNFGTHTHANARNNPSSGELSRFDAFDNISYYQSPTSGT